MIVNRFIPFGSFKAVNLFGLIFVQKGETLSASDLRHEQIHTRQMLELLVLPFYLWYLLEWLLRLVQHRNALRAYFSISFESEAYAHQHEPDYLSRRRPYAWLFRKGRGPRSGVGCGSRDV